MKAFILQNEMQQNMHKTGQYEQREQDDIRKKHKNNLYVESLKNISVFHLNIALINVDILTAVILFYPFSFLEKNVGKFHIKLAHV